MIKKINNELNELKKNHLFRTLRSVNNEGKNLLFNGKKYVNFSSNDYLSLSNNEYVKKKSENYIKKYGCSSTASRLVCGNLSIFEELEQRFAKLKGCEASLMFNTGYMANLGIIQALSDSETMVIADKLIHASVIDAIKLSGVDFKRFKHNSIEDLKRVLEKYSTKYKKIIVVVEAVYSMDGDIAPLQAIYNVVKDYNGFFYVDEAHSTAVYGENGSGLTEKLKNKDDDLIVMATCGKGLGNFGAYFAGSRVVRDYLINKARSFIYATALPPSVIGGLHGALDILYREKRGLDVLEKSKYVRKHLRNVGINILSSFSEGSDYSSNELKYESQIVPIIIGENSRAIKIADNLLENGIFAIAIRPPTVPVGSSRIRITLNYSHSYDELDKLISILKMSYFG